MSRKSAGMSYTCVSHCECQIGEKIVRVVRYYFFSEGMIERML